jgi:hypothetical protein
MNQRKETAVIESDSSCEDDSDMIECDSQQKMID